MSEIESGRTPRGRCHRALLVTASAAFTVLLAASLLALFLSTSAASP